MIKARFVTVVNGMGGDDGDSIPVYGTPSGPAKQWVYVDGGGKQLTLPNGTPLIMVDPGLLTSEEEKKFSGMYNGQEYTRVWFVDPETGKGVDYGSPSSPIAMFVEASHLEYVDIVDDPLEEQDTAEFERCVGIAFLFLLKVVADAFQKD